MGKKLRPSEWSAKRAAKEYGKNYGYFGMVGGWIYRDGKEAIIKETREGVTNFRASRFNGRPICQGWSNFYRLFARDIERYVKSLEEE